MNRYAAIIMMSVSILCSCGGAAISEVDGGDTLTCESSLLTLVDMDGYVLADVASPWGNGDRRLLARYVLVGRDYDGDLPEGTIVRVPVESSVVYSGVYGGVIDELGAIDAVSGVADGHYFTTGTIVERIASGRIVDVGNSASVSIERILDLEPDAILLSPYQNEDLGAVGKSGIPVVQCVDYMERTPLGRAEWVKFIGRLYGCGAEADSLYENVRREYELLRYKVAVLDSAPTVLTEQPMPGGTWDVPAGDSYMARLLMDAGANYPWSGSPGAGSLKLDVAAVLDRAQHADYWLIRSYGPLSAKGLKASNPMSEQFDAYHKGGIYVCDTTESPLFDEFPFHPERLLREYIMIFHPGMIGGEESLRYYKRI